MHHSQQDYDGNNYEEERHIIRSYSIKKILEDSEAIPSEKLELVLIIKFLALKSPKGKQKVEILCPED